MEHNSAYIQLHDGATLTVAYAAEKNRMYMYGGEIAGAAETGMTASPAAAAAQIAATCTSQKLTEGRGGSNERAAMRLWHQASMSAAAARAASRPQSALSAQSRSTSRRQSVRKVMSRACSAACSCCRSSEADAASSPARAPRAGTSSPAPA